jgi:hypothetical protein
VANLLSLRASGPDVFVRFDAPFFDGAVVSLLARRGFVFSASASGPADLRIDGDHAAIERFLGGRASVPACRITAAARVWRALVVVDDGRRRAAAGRSRDVGGQAGWADTGPTKTDSARAPDGRRIKARPRKPSAHLAEPPPPTTSMAAPAASDPAAFALAHLLRLAERVAYAVRDAVDDAVVVVDAGRIVVGGLERATLEGG